MCPTYEHKLLQFMLQIKYSLKMSQDVGEYPGSRTRRIYRKSLLQSGFARVDTIFSSIAKIWYRSTKSCGIYFETCFANFSIRGDYQRLLGKVLWLYRFFKIGEEELRHTPSIWTSLSFLLTLDSNVKELTSSVQLVR